MPIVFTVYPLFVGRWGGMIFFFFLLFFFTQNFSRNHLLISLRVTFTEVFAVVLIIVFVTIAAANTARQLKICRLFSFSLILEF